MNAGESARSIPEIPVKFPCLNFFIGHLEVWGRFSKIRKKTKFFEKKGAFLDFILLLQGHGNARPSARPRGNGHKWENAFTNIASPYHATTATPPPQKMEKSATKKSKQVPPKIPQYHPPLQ